MDPVGMGLLPPGSCLPALLDYRAVRDNDISVRKDDILQVNTYIYICVYVCMFMNY